MRHIINRITGALPKWQKIGWIGCGAALAAIPLLTRSFYRRGPVMTARIYFRNAIMRPIHSRFFG